MWISVMRKTGIWLSKHDREFKNYNPVFELRIKNWKHYSFFETGIKFFKMPITYSSLGLQPLNWMGITVIKTLKIWHSFLVGIERGIICQAPESGVQTFFFCNNDHRRWFLRKKDVHAVLPPCIFYKKYLQQNVKYWLVRRAGVSLRNLPKYNISTYCIVTF